MDGYIDLGKIPVAGYINADPPGEPQFALSANGSGFANSIQRAGGEVTVDEFGGINMEANSGSFVGIDSFANVTVSAVSSGTVLIESAGLGADVDIVNAGSIVFDALGQGILLNVQTINGSVYPPTGSGATTSITQGGGIVACLGNGAVNISSVGAGVDVNVSNAGTITFDTVGSRAIVNLSTVNGVAFPPSFSVPANITVSTLTAASYISTLRLEGVSSINGSAYPSVASQDPTFSTITLGAGGFLATTDAGGYIVSKTFEGLGGNDTTLASASGQTLFINGGQLSGTIDNSIMSLNLDGTIVMNATNIGGDTDGFGLTVGAEGRFITFPSDPTSAFAVGGINNLSTINGVAYPPSFSVPSDVTVSTLTAGSYVSTLSLEGISSINGSAYPFEVSTIGNIATGGFVITTSSNVGMGVMSPVIELLSDYSVTVGTNMAPTSIVYASTIQASSTGLSIFETAGANVRLDTAGKVYFNEGLSTITDGTGLIVGTEGYTLTFPLDTTGSFNVGEIVNLSTINGAEYPIAPRQATYYKSAGQNMTSGANDVTFDLSGAWNNPDGYITHTDGTTDFTVVQAGLYQLEFNATIVANGATWGTGSNKTINIDITRSPNGEHAIIANAALTSSASNYAQCVSGTYYLEAGDIINLRVFNVFSTAVPEIQHVTNTFDLGTFFTWRFIS